MDGKPPIPAEEAARRQLKLYLFAIVGAAGLGTLLMTSLSLLWAVPFLLGLYVCYAWAREPVPDEFEVDDGGDTDADGNVDGGFRK